MQDLDTLGTETFDTSTGDYGGIPVSIPPPSPPIGDSSMSTSDSALLSAGIFPDSTGILGAGNTSAAPSGDSASGFLSGLGDVFQGIGAGVGAGLKAANTPNVPGAGSGWIYNPATGTYTNQYGQTLTATGTIPSLGNLSAMFSGSSGIFMLALVGLGAYFILRKR